MPAPFADQLAQFGRALQRLREAIAAPETDMTRDSAIQRFEFTLDLAWKTVQVFIRDRKGIRCASPKDCFRIAGELDIVADSADWDGWVDLRNSTVHTYNEQFARHVYAQLPDAIRHFSELQDRLQQQR
ncbi:nucleotidyltransferase substrate binding protein [Candidatus Uhrbacteria bacterium]|nr:nucleotidyltransferase substrate binding protein [Candidatus Uhrbacteria bacterium]